MRYILVVLSLLFLAPAGAQQPDPAELSRRLAVVEAQRNQALGWHMASEAARAGLAEELTKALGRIKELEAGKPDQPAKETP